MEEFKPIRYKPIIDINYKLIEASDHTYKSVDRGQSNDRYEVEFYMRGTKEYIFEVVNYLQNLRSTRTPLTLNNIPERYIGENVSNTSLTGLIGKMGKVTSPAFNVWDFTFTFIVDTSTLQFVGTPVLNMLTCLSHNYEAYADWSWSVNETYDRQLYGIDHVQDIYIFKGVYMLQLEDTKNLLQLHKTVRGGDLIVTNAQLGTSSPFGPQVIDETHTTKIIDLTWERVSPMLCKITLELVKVG